MLTICDLDGTLTKTGANDALHCMGETHSKEDILRIMDPVRIARLECNEPIAELVRSRFKEGHTIVIITGRWNLLEEVTMAWMREHNIPFHVIAMRYHDDWKLKSTVVKSAAFEQMIATREMLSLGKEEIEWIDDDDDMLAIARDKYGCKVRKVEVQQ